MISVSVVSHNHGAMVAGVVQRLLTFPEVSQIIVTLNVPEPWSVPEHERVTVLKNTSPKGFGANHNAAYWQSRSARGKTLPTQQSQPRSGARHFMTDDPSLTGAEGSYFCVLNPDIEFKDNPFPVLLNCLRNTGAGVVAPAILDVQGMLADSARYFPTPAGLFRKALGRGDGRYQYGLNDAPCSVDWVAGMFMLFSARAFERLHGFDERYYLYYEDVDICARAHLLQEPVVLCPESVAVHDARRSSRKSFRFMSWHLRSMARYFVKRYLGSFR